jgi:hypothetical protein
MSSNRLVTCNSGTPKPLSAERCGLDVALDAFDAALDVLINTVEAGGLEQLTAAEKISFWQRFETSRNRLPLIDHQLIADADASDLAGEYCFSNLKMFVDSEVAAVSSRSGGPGTGCRSRGTAHLRAW